jgi:CBS domain-containing protein
MQAKDVMTTDVVSVSPDARVGEIARLLLERGISAVPVMDEAGAMIGIVSEGDLVRRLDGSHAPARGSWWLTLLAGAESRAADYIKIYGVRAADVMTKDVVAVDPQTPSRDIARLLEERGIKRVPVVFGSRVVGIVSRANLLQALASAGSAPSISPSDAELRNSILRALSDQAGLRIAFPNILVTDGTVALWGAVDSETERRAAAVAAANVPGVRRVQNHLGVFLDD